MTMGGRVTGNDKILKIFVCRTANIVAVAADIMAVEVKIMAAA